MTRVADIGVDIIGDGTNATAEFKRIASEGKRTFTGMIGDAEGLAHKMHEALGVVRQFKPITELGFGIGIGRQAFEQIHEGIMKVGEGFVEGLQHGETFFEALGDGASRLMGMKTSFEQAAEAAKKYSEQVEILAHAREAIDKITGGGKEDKFSNLSAAENDAYKKQVADLTKARDEAAAEFTKKSKEFDEKKDKFENAGRERARLHAQTTKEDVGEAESAKRAAGALYKRFDDEIKTLGSSYGDANRNRPAEKEQAELEDKMGAQQQAAAKKAKEKAAQHMKDVYHEMAEAAKKGAEKAKQEAKHLDEVVKQNSPFAAAEEKLKDLDKVKSRISADDYGSARRKILEDYAKTKQQGESRGDPGAALQAGSTEAFKAVEESRQAMAGMQDKQAELLAAGNDLTGQVIGRLDTLITKQGTQAPVADFG